MITTIACIVEGHGEVESVPLLIRRIALEIDPARFLQLPPPQRIPANRLLRTGELERAVQFAATKAGPNGAVFILLDCDETQDCPARLGPEYLIRAKGARSDIPLCVVLARREFEAWFLASAESLRGKRGLPQNLEGPAQPEEIRGAKGWLAERMGKNRGYQERLDQPALSQIFDMNLARQRSRSFDKFYRDVERLLSIP